jgi:hypothetical protein
VKLAGLVAKAAANGSGLTLSTLIEHRRIYNMRVFPISGIAAGYEGLTTTQLKAEGKLSAKGDIK